MALECWRSVYAKRAASAGDGEFLFSERRERGHELLFSSVNIAIIDTETTGVDLHDEPIAVCILLLEVDRSKGSLIREVDRYEGFRYPSVPIHRQARAKHGMTRDSLLGKKFDVARIAGMLGRAEILIAHNSSFDARMMCVVWPEIVNKDWLCSYSNWPWPSLSNKKLDSVCQYFNIARPKIHTSFADCDALAQALLRHTGKTDRSRTYLALLLMKTPQRHKYGAPHKALHEPQFTYTEASPWGVWLFWIALILGGIIVLLTNLNK